MPTAGRNTETAGDDAELVRRAREGSPGAFDALFDRHYPKAFNFAHKMCGNRDDAADIAQTAFIRAYDALPRIRDGQAFLGFLYRVVVNLIRDRARLARRKPWVRFVDLLRGPNGEHTDSEPAEFADKTQDPQNLTVAGARSRAVEAAILDLPLDFREALVMHHIQDMDLREIASATGVAEGTVKSRLGRARQRLRSALSEWVEGSEQ